MNDSNRTVVSGVDGMRAELVARAEALIPEVRKRSDVAEEDRHLPKDTVELMRETGIHRILQPARHGGAEEHFSAMVDIVSTVSRGCTSAGWCLTQYCSHNCLLGYWPPEGQDEVWAERPDAVIAGVLIAGCGRATPVDGGWRLSGRWPFASGVYGADWYLAGAFEESDADEKVAWILAVPASEISLIDTWHTAGLRGTGSCDVAVDDVFVPAHRGVRIDQTKGGGNAPGNAVNDAAVHKVPAFAMFSINQAAVCYGIAQRAYADFLEHARTRTSRMSGRNISEFGTTHLGIGEAATCVSTCGMLLHGACEEGMGYGERAEVAPMAVRAKLRADATFGSNLAARAVDLVFDMSGGAGLYDNNPLSRMMRDMKCAQLHITQKWDVSGTNFGRILLGLPSADPGI